MAQDYPKDKMEILVVDGMSEDKTREIIKNWKLKIGNLRLLDNPKKIAPSALNIGVKNSTGEIIMRMDAHARYERDYLSKCVKYLKEYGADNIGGTMKTLPQKSTIVAKAIALSLSHIFGAASRFRIGESQPVAELRSSPTLRSARVKEVDTVFGGCYKREVFDRIGFFNENLIRSQDLEFNLRLKRAGGKIILHPDIVSYYYPKPTLGEFFWHNFQDGIWSILPLKFVKVPFKLRHYIPLIFVLTLPLSFWPYILLSLFFSLQIAAREKDLRLFFAMPLAFATRHFGYGLGSIWGLVKLIL
ncbi:MAG: Glycosyl transferase family 2 [Parcubacteria group bacterium Gr01-1014_30]|nr:MAG: Glycosyl transferase family 2 [Parcubacteria group bacterium Gr01-1014_30]